MILRKKKNKEGLGKRRWVQAPGLSDRNGVQKRGGRKAIRDGGSKGKEVRATKEPPI